MIVPRSIKENPIKTTIGMSGSVVAIVGALFTLDARYAHADDVERNKSEIQALVKDSSQTLRRQMLEDNLFELDVKQGEARDKQLPPVESALKKRYQRELDTLNSAQIRNRSLNQTLPRD